MKTTTMALSTTLMASLLATGTLAAEPWMTAAVRKIVDKPKIIEAFFRKDSPKSLWISMVDNGTRRDGDAQTLCLDLHDAGMPAGSTTTIRIWDAEAIMSGTLKDIGKFECERK